MNLHSTGQDVLSLPSLRGQYNELGGNSLFGGTSLGPLPRVLKELGPTRGLPPANWGYTHTCHACWWQVWHFNQMIGGSSLSGPTQPSILPGLVHEQGGTLGLPGGNSWALPRALKTWELSQRARGLLQWYSGNGRDCRP